ncbi:hypothetical protein LY78DRAFT_570318 [Colletotrichum sublineola]|nr:hypothetical protein LY78DRAFT_570318 [Colletotrichum sublineola]
MGSKPGRRKSCAPCRASKARCSLESPCRRCEERNLDCKYDHTPKRSAAYRALRPLPALGEHISGDLNQPDSYVEQLVHNGNTPTGLLMETQDGPIGEASMDWDALLSPSSLHLSSSYELELPELPSPFSTTRLNTPQGPRVIPEPSGLPRLWNHHQSDVLDDQRALLSLGSPKPSHAAKASQLLTQSKNYQPQTPLPTYQTRPLAPRRNNTVASCFTVKVLLGQLLAYPKMMAKGGRLPPFIFPPCCMEGYRLPADRCGEEFHKCLPETLAICCNLVQSFEARTAGSFSFVWKNIYKEVERIQCEYTSYDYKGLLQALQAVLTYLLLQAGDPDSIPENNIMTLLTAPGAIARALCMAYDYTGNLTSSTKVDRQEWVIRESIRR